MTAILGLAGKAGSGKDYVCEGFSQWLLTARVAFADEVKRECAEEFGEVRPDLNFWAKPTGEEERAILQKWGTDFRRAQDPDYWVKKGTATIVKAARYAELVVVTDVRFANEAQAIHEAGGFVAEVIAHDHVRAERLGGTLPPTHASEVIDFPVDGIIRNFDYPILPPALNEWLKVPDHFQPFAPSGGSS